MTVKESLLDDLEREIDDLELDRALGQDTEYSLSPSVVEYESSAMARMNRIKDILSKLREDDERKENDD